MVVLDGKSTRSTPSCKAWKFKLYKLFVGNAISTTTLEWHHRITKIRKIVL